MANTGEHAVQLASATTLVSLIGRRGCPIGELQARSKPATYRFDNVFGPDASQAQVFEHVKPVADMVVSGINATVMAYG